MRHIAGQNGGESGIRTRGTPLKGVQSLSRRSLSATQPSLHDPDCLCLSTRPDRLSSVAGSKTRMNHPTTSYQKEQLRESSAFFWCKSYHHPWQDASPYLGNSDARQPDTLHPIKTRLFLEIHPGRMLLSENGTALSVSVETAH